MSLNTFTWRWFAVAAGCCVSGQSERCSGAWISTDVLAEWIRIEAHSSSLQNLAVVSVEIAPRLAPSERRCWAVSSMHAIDTSKRGRATGSGGQAVSRSPCGLWVLANHLSVVISRFFPIAAPASCASQFVFMVYPQMETG